MIGTCPVYHGGHTKKAILSTLVLESNPGIMNVNTLEARLFKTFSLTLTAVSTCNSMLQGFENVANFGVTIFYLQDWSAHKSIELKKNF